jgi:hypothetical protein
VLGSLWVGSPPPSLAISGWSAASATWSSVGTQPATTASASPAPVQMTSTSSPTAGSGAISPNGETQRRKPVSARTCGRLTWTRRASASTTETSPR